MIHWREGHADINRLREIRSRTAVPKMALHMGFYSSLI